MQITIYSILMSVMWAIVMVLFAYIVQRCKGTMQYWGVSCMIVVYIFCALRMLLPIELPITKTISLENPYNMISRFLCIEIIGKTILLKHVLLCVWGIIAFVKLCLLIRDYRQSGRMLSVFFLENEGTACEILDKLQKEYQDKRKIQIYRTPFLYPLEMGIVHSIILLPERPYTEQCLYYTMKHEYIHILHHDAEVKLFANLLRCVFWWNPITYLIASCIENALELRCDLAMAGTMGNEEKVQYLTVLLDAVRYEKNNKNARRRMHKNEIALYRTDKKAQIVKRFRYISECEKMTKRRQRRCKMYMTAILATFTGIFLASYAVVLHPCFHPSVEDVVDGEDVYMIDPNTTFLRKKETGYEVIREEKCVGNIDEAVALRMLELGFKTEEEFVK
ncbi:MAG: M56 family metallopeptidase [Roseburia sp.]|nr:M56 family metallopeptidase [Roseburia sp.]